MSRVLDVPGVRCPRVLDVWVLGVSMLDVPMLDVPMLDVFEPPPVGPHPHLPQKHTCTCFCRSSRCKESVRCASSSLSTWAKLNDFLFRYVHNMYIEQFYLNKICILFISSVFAFNLFITIWIQTQYIVLLNQVIIDLLMKRCWSPRWLGWAPGWEWKL